MIGQRFGRLITLIDADKVTLATKVPCQCDCGVTKSILKSQLVYGRVVSCRCYQKERMKERSITHGKTKTLIYGIWCTMKARCNFPSQDSYYLYGGRGIKVCKEWSESFEKFYSDMGDIPFKGAQIDRIDNNGDYEPTNCRWVSRKENSLNKRDTVFLTCGGITKTLIAWAEDLGVTRQTLMSRRWYGWDDEKIILTPVQNHKPYAPRKGGCAT